MEKITLHSDTKQATSQINRVVRTEVDAAYERMLDPIAGSPATGKTLAGIMNLFVDDLSGTGGTEMEQRVQPDIERISKLVQKTGVM